MNCPKCRSCLNKVKESRPVTSNVDQKLTGRKGMVNRANCGYFLGDLQRRRRWCNSCGHKFTTFEVIADDLNGLFDVLAYAEKQNPSTKTERVALSIDKMKELADEMEAATSRFQRAIKDLS